MSSPKQGQIYQSNNVIKVQICQLIKTDKNTKNLTKQKFRMFRKCVTYFCFLNIMFLQHELQLCTHKSKHTRHTKKLSNAVVILKLYWLEFSRIHFHRDSPWSCSIGDKQQRATRLSGQLVSQRWHWQHNITLLLGPVASAASDLMQSAVIE